MKDLGLGGEFDMKDNVELSQKGNQVLLAF